MTNWSPKKINYIIDQYTGIIGDVLIPLTTPKAEPGGVAAGAVKGFTLDTVSTNKIATEFYDKVEELKYAKNSEDKKTAARAKAENTVIQRYVREISELNKLMRHVQNSDQPNDKKQARVRDLKATISALQQSALSKLNG